MIGVICAMDIEVSGLIEIMSDINREDRLGFCFYGGKIMGKEVTVVKSGIGKVNAAAATALLIGEYGAEVVVNIGVCGGTCGTGKLIIADSVVQYDFDTTAIGDELARLDGFDSPYIKCTYDTSSVPCDVRGVIASGDKFVSGETSGWLKGTFGAVGFDMESGAVAQICTQAKVPFAVFRVVSDGGDPVEYEQFKRIAARRGIDSFLSLMKQGRK